MNFADIGPQDTLALIITALTGAAVGSFLSLITYRMPRELDTVVSRSRCTHCSRSLSLRDLIPVFSWLLARGKCRGCDNPIGLRYPLIELACALGTVALVLQFGFTLQALALTGLWWSVVALIVTDLEHYIILDEVQIAAALFGALYVYATGMHWLAPAIAAISGVILGLLLKYGFLWCCNKDGLGMGDVKFLGVAGIWLSDAANFIPFLFFAGLLGIFSGIVWRVLQRGEQFPFGPALAMSLLLCVLFPAAPNGFWQLYGVVR